MLKEITIEITGRCYNRCIHCSSCSHMYNNSILHCTNVIDIIKEAESLGATKINISGGEPLSHPNILSILRSFKYSNMDVSIYSSGIFKAGMPIPYGLLLKHIKLYASKIVFNMQAADNDLYKKIIGCDYDIDILLESIKRSVRSGITTEVNFVPMKINIDQIEPVLSLCESIGVSKVNFLRLVNQGRAKDNQDMISLSENDIELLKTKLTNISKDKKYNIRIGNPLLNTGCNCEVIRNEKLVIKYDGEVVPCEAFKEYISDDKCDNIYNKSLSDIYNNSIILSNLRNKCIKAVSGLNESCPAQILIKK